MGGPTSNEGTDTRYLGIDVFCGGAYLVDRLPVMIITGPVAQWTTRLTTNQKIAGSSPARIGYLFWLISTSYSCQSLRYQSDPSIEIV